jgi:hypothetical protein
MGTIDFECCGINTATGCMVYKYTGGSAIGNPFPGGSGTVYKGLFYTVNSGVIASHDLLKCKCIVCVFHVMK